MRKHILLGLGAVVAFGIPAISQAPGAARPSFEVASIKATKSGDNRGMIRNAGGGRLSVVGATVKVLIGTAYRIRDFQISGGPNWINSDKFDIDAKARTVTDMTQERIPLLLQKLLADRFQLKAHIETKQLPVYELVVAKGGPKLRAVPAPQRPTPGTAPQSLPAPDAPLPPGSMRGDRGVMMGSAVPIRNIAQALSREIGQTVVDKTGLTEFFDFTLQWKPYDVQGGPAGVSAEIITPTGNPAVPSILVAVQEQLGLRLDPTTGPVEVLVIEHVEKPAEN